MNENNENCIIEEEINTRSSSSYFFIFIWLNPTSPGVIAVHRNLFWLLISHFDAESWYPMSPHWNITQFLASASSIFPFGSFRRPHPARRFEVYHHASENRRHFDKQNVSKNTRLGIQFSLIPFSFHHEDDLSCYCCIASAILLDRILLYVNYTQLWCHAHHPFPRGDYNAWWYWNYYYLNDNR